MSEGGSTPRPVPGAIFWRALSALVLVHLILLSPERLSRLAPDAFLGLAVELPLIVLILLIAPPASQNFVRGAIVAAAGLVLMLKLGDIGGYLAIGRRFDPLTDWRTFGPGWTFATESLGLGAVVAAIIAMLAVLALVLWLLAGGLAALSRLVARGSTRNRALVAASCVVLCGLALAGPAPAPGAALLADHAALSIANARDLPKLVAEAETDPVAGLDGDELFSGIAGSDVILAFVESYGRSAHEDPLYAPTVRARLEGFEEMLARRGLAARSAWLTSPVVGGRSWLAHATLLSGLWIDRQQRYDWLVASERKTLNALFSEAGWRSVAVMPAITMAWPEGEYYRYDAVYAADGLGYRGKPFNWVTMPDQYTLSALQSLELSAAERAPVMAEVALISSHAPWTPIPPVIDWDEVGDGRVFDIHAEAGDPPSVVWRDPDRVRDQYRKAVDYALAALAGFVERYGSQDMVVILLGDHQPASIVTGEDASRDVPVHIIGDPGGAALRWAGEAGWSEGLRPDGNAARWRMDRFRERFVRGLSGGGTRPQSSSDMSMAWPARRALVRR